MRYFKAGIALLLPLALVALVLQWLYNTSSGLVDYIFPDQKWWYPILGFVIIIGVIFIIGIVFSWISPIRWIYKKIEYWVIDKIPGINKIYGFGKEVSDAFITDIKNDGDLAVVAVKMLGGESLGVLIDPKHNTVFVPTAPNPTNGFLIRTDKYRFIETMSYTDALKFVTSIGRLNGGKWQ